MDLVIEQLMTKALRQDTIHSEVLKLIEAIIAIGGNDAREALTEIATKAFMPSERAKALEGIVLLSKNLNVITR